MPIRSKRAVIVTVNSRRWRYPLGLLLALALTALLPAPASALITQSFQTTEPLVVGNLVSLSPNEPNTVRAATIANVASLYGVVTSVQTGTAEVATSELVATLVSNAAGDIVTGSPITASDVKGVGELATTSTRIIGFAEAPFSAGLKSAQIKTLKDAAGKSHVIAFGSVPVILGAANWISAAGSTTGTNGEGTWVPHAVQNFFASIAGHQVVPSRIILSMFLLCVVVVIIGMLIGTSVHTSIISIGRNPLASRSLLKALLQVVFVVLLLMAGSGVAVYFIVTH
jgi:hypothetical protein